MSHQMSVDECRRMKTSHRQMQANADECRRVTRLVQTNQKHFTLIPEKPTHGPIFLLLQLCNSKPHRRANLQFYSFICYYCSSQFSHSSHQQNPFAYLFTYYMQTQTELLLKRPVTKMGGPPALGGWGVGQGWLETQPPSPPPIPAKH